MSNVPNKKFLEYLYNYQFDILDVSNDALKQHLNETVMTSDWKEMTKKALGDVLNSNKTNEYKIPIPGQKNDEFSYGLFLDSLIDYTGLITENIIVIYSVNNTRCVNLIPENSLDTLPRCLAIPKKLKELRILGKSSNGLVSVYNAKYSSSDGKLFKVNIDADGEARSGIPVKDYHHLFLESGFLDGEEFYTTK